MAQPRRKAEIRKNCLALTGHLEVREIISHCSGSPDGQPGSKVSGRDSGDAAGTSNSTNVRLTRQKSALYQWLAVPLEADFSFCHLKKGPWSSGGRAG